MRIDGLEFPARIVDLHLPVDTALRAIDVGGPRRHFVVQRPEVADAAPAHALARHRAQFVLRDVQPAPVFRRVAELDATNQFPCPGRLEHFVEGSLGVRVEVVAHQGDLRAVGVASFQQAGDLQRPVHLRSHLVMCLPGLMGPPTEREHEQIATIHSVAGLGAPPDRPLRYPHFTASPRAMTGWNGQRSRAQPQPAEPGEISLAHNGVLAIELAHPWSREAVERVIDAASKGYTTDGMPGRVVIAGIGTAGSETESELENRLEVDASARDEEETNPDPEGWTRKLVRQVRAAQYAQDRRYGEGQRNGTVPAGRLQELSQLTAGGREALGEHARDDSTALRLTRIARTLADLKENETVTAARVEEAARVAVATKSNGRTR